MTPEEARERLKQVIDPELHVNIVDLGLIYEVKVDWNASPKIFILMTLTSPGCPLAGTFHILVREAFADIPDLETMQDVQVDLTFDPPWTQDMMTEELKAKFGFDGW